MAARGLPAGGTTAPLRNLPAGPPEDVCDLATLPQAALLYRLSGDDNPLHADPVMARAAGFSRSLLHDRSTFGAGGQALLRSCCDYDPARLTAMQARFTVPSIRERPSER